MLTATGSGNSGGEDGRGQSNNNNIIHSNNNKASSTEGDDSITVEGITLNTSMFDYVNVSNTMDVIQVNMNKSCSALMSLLEKSKDDEIRTKGNRKEVKSICVDIKGYYNQWSFLQQTLINQLGEKKDELSGEEADNVMHAIGEQKTVHEEVTKYVMKLLDDAKYDGINNVVHMKSLLDEIRKQESNLNQQLNNVVFNEDSYDKESGKLKSSDFLTKFKTDIDAWSENVNRCIRLALEIRAQFEKMDNAAGVEKDESDVLYQLREIITELDNKHKEIVLVARSICDELHDGVIFDPEVEKEVVAIKKKWNRDKEREFWDWMERSGETVVQNIDWYDNAYAQIGVDRWPGNKEGRKASQHPLHKYLQRNNGVNPLPTVDTLTYTYKTEGKSKTVTLCEVMKIVQGAANETELLLGEKIAVILRIGNKQTPWWIEILTIEQQAAVYAINSWKKDKHSPTYKWAVSKLEAVGLCLDNDSKFKEFMKDAKSADSTTTHNEWACIMLRVLGHDEHIPCDRRSFSSEQGMIDMGKKVHKELPFIKPLETVKSIQQEQFEGMKAGIVIVDKFLQAKTNAKSQPSVQLKEMLTRLGIMCQCLHCQQNEQKINACRQLDHWNDVAREFKQKFKGQPSEYTMDTLIKHLEANALLMCCQIAHRLKDTNGLSMIASGLMDNLYEDNNYEYLQTKYSIQQLINSRFLNILDGEFHGGETVFGKHKIPLECSGAKDYHHYTGLRNLGLCSSDTFNVLKSLLCLDKSKLESTVEELVDKEEIEVFKTAKNNNIGDLIQESINLTKVEENLTTEYFKTGSLLCIDHTVYTRVIEQPELMNILGVEDPFVYTSTLMIMNKEWMNKLPTVDKKIGIDEQTSRLDAFLVDNKPKDRAWDNKNLDKYIENMNKSSKTTYGELGWVPDAK